MFGPASRSRTFRNSHLAYFLGMLLAGHCMPNSGLRQAHAEDAPRKVLLIAGPPSHGYGAHEHFAGLKVLEESINDRAQSVEVEVIKGWPTNTQKIESADSIVIYCDGGRRHIAMTHRDELKSHLKKGGGLVALHYAVEMLPGDSGDDWTQMLGGHFEIHRSVNPHWTANFANLPNHPISQGVKPTKVEDEWYFYLRFADSDKLTPILQAIAPEETMRRPDGAHSGNPTVRKSVANGEQQTVAWAFESELGGRSFGFTGGHHHWNWANDSMRRLVTNAILWSAGSQVTPEPSKASPLSRSQMLANQDYDPPKNFSFDSVQEKFGISVAPDSSEPGKTGPEKKKPKLNNSDKPAPANRNAASATSNSSDDSLLLAVTPLVTTQTSRHQIEMLVDLDRLNAARDFYLVVTDGGDGFTCDWANWIDPTLYDEQGRKQSLLELDWVSATCGFKKVCKNTNCAGDPVTVREKPMGQAAIGTHARSVIHYRIPKRFTRFSVIGALDSAGTRQHDGTKSSVRFAAFTGAAPTKLKQLDQRLNTGQRDPENAIAGLEVAEGLEVTLLGSEPDLRSLTNLDIDHRGRVWVCDVMNYRGRNGVRPEGDRILILEDTTGDGKLDKVKTFYQGRDIDSAMGICVLGNEVIVSASPTIWRFTDTDGDDVPDSKVAMFTETGMPQHDHSAHSFLFGPDGKLYWNFGNTGRQVKDANGETVVDIHGRPVVDNGQPLFGGMPFRCDLDGSNFEVLAHNFRNNWETTVDSFGSLWQSDNDDDGNRGTRINFVMEQGNYGYRDEKTGAGWAADRITLEEEIPHRHWHLNDPGVVPNLLQTGAGSPSGICYYEGRLLPKRFWNQSIHCDPGPNIVRAYPTELDGAGYSAKIDPLVTGKIDKWFRPADVCVAPDGSLFVTDWYDPGVGGHRQEDSDRGRLFRIAPPGHSYQVPSFDFETARGCAQALRNPNRSVRYLAWTKLHALGADAQQALLELYTDDDPVIRARALWLLGQIEGFQDDYIQTALADANPNIQIVGIRLAKLIGRSPAELCASVARDRSSAVRRELALSLRYDQSDAMPGVWATLAKQYDGKDRWYLEALGIGSDVRPQECFDAWLGQVGTDWKSPPGRDIVWRVRTPEAAIKMAELVANPDLPLAETDRYFRSLEFHDDSSRQAAIKQLLVATQKANQKKQSRTIDETDEIIVRAVMRLPKGAALASSTDAVQAVTRHIQRRAGTPDFMSLIERFQPKNMDKELTAMMLKRGDDTNSLKAVRYLLKGKDAYHTFVAGLRQRNETDATRIASLLGSLGNGRTVNILTTIMTDPDLPYPKRAAAVRGLAKNNLGVESLLSSVENKKMPADLELLAGGLLAKNADASIQKRAAKLLPQPEVASGQNQLATLDELVKIRGDVSHGLELFRNQATCSKCHIVRGNGKQVGPDLSEIGSKLSREAMFTSILAPSAGISHNYENHILLLESGQVVNGILVTETEASVVLRNAEAIDIEYARDDIVEMKKSETSIMPANLHQTTDQQGLVDLVEYLMTLKKK